MTISHRILVSKKSRGVGMLTIAFQVSFVPHVSIDSLYPLY